MVGALACKNISKIKQKNGALKNAFAAVVF
jgi:hypothetical protein